MSTSISLGNISDQDIKSPFNFFLWKKYNPLVSANVAQSKYNIYLKNWYAKREAYQKSQVVDKIKNEYIAFLKELQPSFTTVEEKAFLESISFDDDLDISQSIPFYARKLKQIAYHVARKRDEAKFSKLKYNLKGTSTGIEKIFYNYLLNAFTKKNEHDFVFDQTLYDSYPELSAVNENLKIDVVELYDESNYFDLAPETFLSSDYSTFYDPNYYTSAYLTELHRFEVEEQYSEYLGSDLNGLSAHVLSGSTEIVYELSSGIIAKRPFENILNTFYPSLVLLTKTMLLKTKDELGGYFIPKNLGYSQFANYEYQSVFDTTFTIFDKEIEIPKSDIYDSNYISLNGGYVDSPVIHIDNPDWLKSSKLGNYSGYGVQRTLNDKFQRFGSPYQTREEELKGTIHGVSRFDDDTDFWYKNGNAWKDSTIFQLDERYNFDSDDRQRKLILNDNNLYYWGITTDGIEIALYKDFTDSDTIFDKKYNMVGDVWVRTPFGNVDTFATLFSNIISKYKDDSFYNSLSASSFRNVEIVEDVLIIDLQTFIIVEKIEYDFENNIIKSKTSLKHVIDYSNTNTLYGEFWYDEFKNVILFAGVEAFYDNVLSGSNFQPIVHRYLMDDDILESDGNTYDYSQFTLQSLSATAFEPPVITYNIDADEYVMGLMVKRDKNINIVQYNFQIQ